MQTLSLTTVPHLTAACHRFRSPCVCICVLHDFVGLINLRIIRYFDHLMHDSRAVAELKGGDRATGSGRLRDLPLLREARLPDGAAHRRGKVLPSRLFPM